MSYSPHYYPGIYSTAGLWVTIIFLVIGILVAAAMMYLFSRFYSWSWGRLLQKSANLNLVLTCPSCGEEFARTKGRICPNCGNRFDLDENKKNKHQ